MIAKKSGLLSEFQRIASSDLSKNTLSTYTCWLKAFHRFTKMLKIPGNDIATVSKMLGHESLETTAIYVHADEAPGTSPLDVSLAPPSSVFSIKNQPSLLP